MSIPVTEAATVVVYVYEGMVSVGNQTLSAGQAAVMGRGDELNVTGVDPSRLLVLAAEPLNEPVYHHGPFVMNTRAEIDQALSDYRDGTLAWRPA